MKFNEIEKIIKLTENEELIKNIENLEAITENSNKEFTSNIIEASEKEITPEEEEGKKLINFGNIIRNFGYRLLNLLHIEITCSFAGVTLFHWSIPKVENGKCVDKKSNNNKNK